MYMILEQFTETRHWAIGEVNVAMVKIQCDNCGTVHNREHKHFKKMKQHPLFDLEYCNKCWRPKIYGTPEYLAKMTAGVKKAYENLELRKRMSEIVTGRNTGDKNPMKRAEVRAKVSATRRQLFADPVTGPAIKKKIAAASRTAWEEGKYIGAKTGKTKWYDYTHSSGTVYKVQGTWELKFIKWLDQNNMEFTCHRGKIPYTARDGSLHNYYPDFFVNDWNCYADPKGEHWYKKQIEKFELLTEQHPDITIRILHRKDLVKLGIKV